MELAWFRTLWGSVGAGTPHAEFGSVVDATVAEGWDGVVYAPIAARFDETLGPLSELAELCGAGGLDLAVMIHTWGEDLATHLAELRTELGAAAEVSPHHVIAHTGLDRFDAGETDELVDAAAEMAATFGVGLVHETHRHRPLFTPWATRDVLARRPELPLAVDLSHWVVVAERLLAGEDEIVDRVGANAWHLDARVGHEQGPQVPEPAAPEWADHVATFDGWWRRIAAAAAANGRERLVVVPEYGPPPYQQTLPFTGTPTTDLWSTCLAERERLKVVLG